MLRGCCVDVVFGQTRINLHFDIVDWMRVVLLFDFIALVRLGLFDSIISGQIELFECLDADSLVGLEHDGLGDYLLNGSHPVLTLRLVNHLLDRTSLRGGHQ